MRRVIAVMLALAGTLLVPVAARADFVSPAECATGGSNGVVDGGSPGVGSVCVGAGGHTALYVGGDPARLCGQVILADLNVVEGPTTRTPSDPNQCPYAGWSTQVHDPAVAKEGGRYYLFGTGPGLAIWSSTDLQTWTRVGRVFAAGLPAWATALVPGAVDPWAPDLSFFAGRWHVYYAVSTFGAKRSAIGVATTPTLDPADPRYKWTDEGVVVTSGDTTDYNAIDPNVFIDRAGTPWLDFGSFFSGIKLVALDATTGKPTEDVLRPIASRLVPSWGIEAPFLIRRGGYHYLFVSFDACCRGSESTYNIRVGRSRSLDGPYVDDRGVPLLVGGGRLVLQGRGARRGPGHNAVLKDGRKSLLVFHYYDATAAGTAKLGIIPLRWTADGWPTAKWSALRPTTFTS